MSDETDILRRLSRIEQRISNLVRTGRIAVVQDSPPRVKVEYDKDSDGQAVLTGWLCYFEERQGYVQTWNPPKVGEQCLIVSASGDLRLGKVMLGLNTSENAPVSSNPAIHKLRFSDGSTFTYDRSAHQWDISLAAGEAVFTGKTYTFNCDVQVNGNVTCSKTVTANDFVGPKGSIIAIYNGHSHSGKVPTPGSQM